MKSHDKLSWYAEQNLINMPACNANISDEYLTDLLFSRIGSMDTMDARHARGRGGLYGAYEKKQPREGGQD